jgi:hypothetical protein
MCVLMQAEQVACLLQTRRPPTAHLAALVCAVHAVAHEVGVPLAVWCACVCPGGGFKRPFTEYLQRLERFVAYDMPKILYCDPSHENEVGRTAPHRTAHP